METTQVSMEHGAVKVLFVQVGFALPLLLVTPSTIYLDVYHNNSLSLSLGTHAVVVQSIILFLIHAVSLVGGSVTIHSA